MSPIVAAAAVMLAALVLLAYLVGLGMGRRGESARNRVAARLLRGAHQPLVAQARPIEDIAADLRRLGSRFHQLDPRASYAKTEAVRAGYDRALGECCTALGLTHLLGVLPVGPQLDAERQRVEALLGDAGVRLPHAA